LTPLASKPRKLVKRQRPPPLQLTAKPDIQIDAVEFLTLGPEPWMDVSVTPTKMNFGLLPSDFRLTRCESLLSLYSFYSRTSYDWENSRVAWEDDDDIESQDPESSSSSSSLPYFGLMQQEDDDFLFPVPRQSEVCFSFKESKKGGEGDVEYYTNIPDFRQSFIIFPKPPSSPPPSRRTYSEANTSPTSRSKPPLGGLERNSIATAAPLLTRRLNFSSATSLARRSQAM